MQARQVGGAACLHQCLQHRVSATICSLGIAASWPDHAAQHSTSSAASRFLMMQFYQRVCCRSWLAPGRVNMSDGICVHARWCLAILPERWPCVRTSRHLTILLCLMAPVCTQSWCLNVLPSLMARVCTPSWCLAMLSSLVASVCQGSWLLALLHCLQVQANVVALNEAALRISQKLQAALGKAGDQGASTGRCAPACWVGLNCNGLMGGRQQAGV